MAGSLRYRNVDTMPRCPECCRPYRPGLAQDVFRAVKTGSRTVGSVLSRVNRNGEVSIKRVYNTLTYLRRCGRLKRIGQGQYVPATSDRP